MERRVAVKDAGEEGTMPSPGLYTKRRLERDWLKQLHFLSARTQYVVR